MDEDWNDFAEGTDAAARHSVDECITESASKAKDFSRVAGRAGDCKGGKNGIRPDTGGCQPDATPKEDLLRVLKKREGKVMLVEDVAFNLFAIKSALNSKGTKYDEAKDGLEAVDLFREQSYEVIFMDLNMPNMDGYEATRKIRELEAIKRPKHKVFICGLSAEDDEGKECVEGRNNKEVQRVRHGRLHEEALENQRAAFDCPKGV